MKPLYIFDLDGTLADCAHRRHFVENRANEWDKFHAACVDDTPIPGVIRTLNRLRRDCDIYIFSGRSDIVRGESSTWLINHTELTCNDITTRFWMRRHGNYTPDDVLKMHWYDTLSDDDKQRLVATFDDRDRIVAMWRALGITCFQCAPGDF